MAWNTHYVERYLRPYAGRMSDLASAYMAVLWPAAVRKPLSILEGAKSPVAGPV